MKEVSLNFIKWLSAANQIVGPFTKAGRLQKVLLRTALALTLLWLAGCGAINVGKWKGIERAGSGEEYYLAKDIYLTAGSAFHQRNAFDHNMHESINLFFVPRHETNTYILESIWYDPTGQEFRTIRTSYDKQRETSKGEERAESGTPRHHSMPTKDLFKHKPGSWKVAMYLDGKLVRKLDFTVR
jgi:hypothetical protein